MDPVTARDGGVVLAVRVRPKTQPVGVAGVQNERIVIRVSAAPSDGAANAAVIKVLADKLGVPKSAISIVRGQTTRDKEIAVAGISEAETHERLGF